jgi:hypothetical protein
MTGEVGSDTYSDVELDKFIADADSDLNVAASRIWGEKASDYADLVNITEAGSSRANSDLFKHAKEQAAYFSGLGGDVDVDPDEIAVPGYSTTRRIVRL